MGPHRGVVNLLDTRVLLQDPCKLCCCVVLLHHAQAERLETADEEVGGVGVDHASEHPLQLSHLIDQVLLAGESAAHHIVVACEVLGPAVEHKVRPKLDGPVVDRGREGGVDAGNYVVLLAELANALGIDDAGERIGDLLRKEQCSSLGLQDPLQLVAVSRIDDREADAHLGQDGSNKLASAAVAVGRRHDVPIRVDEGQEHRGDGVHAARRHDAILRALQGHDLLLGCADCRVAVAAILERLVSSLVVADNLGRVSECEGRCLHDRSR
mmetsp:Transcript_34676/g.67984  ORF Transcript_34676/g.67984 Transcript_34676/m.67984 type:complete len:269 (+) Transcript_34676:1147-1953(+)